MHFSNFLSTYREQNSLSKKEMAEKLEVTSMYYGRFERGDLLPTTQSIKRFSEKLDIPLEELEQFVN